MLEQRLQNLYGPEVAARVLPDLEALLERHRRQGGGRPRARTGFTQRDAVLITYADSFIEPGLAPLGALGEFTAAHLQGLFSAVHVLPFFPWSSDYGFAVKDYLAVDPRLGGWDDVAALAGRFRLMFDLVLNHASAESSWFEAYRRDEPPYDRFFLSADPKADLSAVVRPRTTPLLTPFETVRGPRWVWTTFGPDQVDLDYSNPELLLRMIDVLLRYIERGAGLVRLDAVGYLWKEIGTSCIHLPQTHEVVRLLREALDAVAPDVAIVTETNVPHADNVSYFGDGHDEAQMVYQFPLAPLVLDALARGEASRLATWADGLNTRSTEATFFNFLASHDGIGLVPARGLLPEADVAGLVRQVLAHGGQVSTKTDAGGGESVYELNCTWFDAVSDPASSEPATVQRARFLASQAVMLALAGVPGVYVHSLFGSPNDQSGYARSGWKRDLNHERLKMPAVLSDLAGGLTRRAQVFSGLARLLRARRSVGAFHPTAPQRVIEPAPGVLAVLRGPYQGSLVLALHNLSAEPRLVDGEGLGGLAGATDLLGGPGVAAGAPVALAPYQVAWFKVAAGLRPLAQGRDKSHRSSPLKNAR
ncbi:MAG: sugar phosphorylase [Candidatus Dormibacteraeota bacterium]|nr:sugar phosphorylase [Candidatus Dormibacteraeota bacterium]